MKRLRWHYGKKRDEREKLERPYPLIYMGPTTKWGLVKDVRCKIIDKRAGGVVIIVPGDQTFVVARKHVQPANIVKGMVTRGR